MKLFDLLPEERRGLRIFLAWHLGYALYVCLFVFFIFQFNLFKSYWFLKESWLINMVAPAHTLVFIAVSPYRRDWVEAIAKMYRELDGDLVFFLMAILVLAVGFYLYSLMIWLTGSLLPIIFFN